MSQFFSQCVNIYLSIPSPQMLEKKLFLGALNIYPCYYSFNHQIFSIKIFFLNQNIFPFLNIFSCSQSTVYHPHRFAW